MPSEDASSELRALVRWRCVTSGFPRLEYVTDGPPSFSIEYRYGTVTVFEDDTATRFEQRIGDAYDAWWSDEETTVYLFELDRALRDGTLDALRLPTLHEARGHRLFRKGLVPIRTVGLVCEKVAAPPSSSQKKKVLRRRRREGLHDHDGRCFVEAPAMDEAAWALARPEARERLLRARPTYSFSERERCERMTVDERNVRYWAPGPPAEVVDRLDARLRRLDLPCRVRTKDHPGAWSPWDQAPATFRDALDFARRRWQHEVAVVLESPASEHTLWSSERGDVVELPAALRE